jgi:hypothetical protein
MARTAPGGAPEQRPDGGQADRCGEAVAEEAEHVAGPGREGGHVVPPEPGPARVPPQDGVAPAAFPDKVQPEHHQGGHHPDQPRAGGTDAGQPLHQQRDADATREAPIPVLARAVAILSASVPSAPAPAGDPSGVPTPDAKNAGASGTRPA